MLSVLEGLRERQRRAWNCSAVSARLPCIGLAVARYVSSLALRDRRSWSIRIFLGGPPQRCGSEMVAVAAARSDWLRRFAISADVVFCGKRHADQPREPNLRR